MMTFVMILTLFLTGPGSPDDRGQGDTIVFFGDSITELGVKPNGYVTRIQKYFRDAGSHVRIVGAGVSGNKVPDLLRRLDKDVLSFKPAIVVVYIGINDVWHFAVKNLRGTPKDEYRSGLGELIERIQKVGAQVILCTPSVIGEKHNGQNPQDAMLDEYAAISRSVAEEKNAVLCDLRALFIRYEEEHNESNADRGILTYDGVHLNDAGNKFVADELINMLDVQ